MKIVMIKLSPNKDLSNGLLDKNKKGDKFVI